MKAYVRRRLLVIVFAVFSLLFLLLFFHFTQGTNEQSQSLNSGVQSQVVNKASPGLPVRLIIPAINVNAKIQYVGVTPDGTMGVPSNTTDVGWFRFGPLPGNGGSAVIVGHLDGQNGEAGVFINLYQLKKGDKLYIEDDKGTTISFLVQENRIYNPGYVNNVFSGSNGAHLNLITCDGIWDGAKKSYSKRLVVFTDIAH